MRPVRILAAVALSAGGLTACVPRGGDAVSVYPIPAEITGRPVCDPGMPDVSAQIEAWLQSLPNGVTARLGRNQCYRTELPVLVAAHSNFTLDGNGSRLQAFTDGCASQSPDGIPYNDCLFVAPSHDLQNRWPRNRSRLRIHGNRNIVIRNLTVDGGHPNPGPDGAYVADLEAQHAFDFVKNNDGIVLDSVRADRVYGDYIYVSGTHHLTVRNSTFGEEFGNGRHGFAVVDGTNITVANNRFMNVRRGHIVMEPVSSGAVIRDIAIDHNTFGLSRLLFFSNHPYAGADPIMENIFIRHNTLVGEVFDVDVVTATNPNPNDPSTYRRRNYQFIDNTSNAKGGNPSARLVRIWGVDGVLLNGNKLPTAERRNMALLEAVYSRGITVIGNSTLNAVDTARYNGSASMCERENLIGNPLAAEVVTVAACP